jgi:hypothetical protein
MDVVLTAKRNTPWVYVCDFWAYAPSKKSNQLPVKFIASD